MRESTTLEAAPGSEITTSGTGLRSLITSQRLIIVAFVLLLLAATTVRLLTFERYLPYLDNGDEVTYYLIARNRAGTYDDAYFEQRYAASSPGHIVINVFLQRVVDSLIPRNWSLPSDHIYVARLLAAFMGVATAMIIATIGWQLAGPVAGWFAGFIWAMAPAIVEINSLATPDPFVYLTCAAAIAMAVHARHKESPQWLFGSLIFAILAIYFKAWPIHTLIPWGVTALVLTRRKPRRYLFWLGAQLAVGLIAGAYFMFFVNPLSASARETNLFREQGLGMMLTPARNLNNLWHAVSPIGHTLFYVVIAGATLAYLYSRRRGWRTLDIWRLIVLLIYCLAGLLIVSSFMNVRIDFLEEKRHVFPISIALIPLWAAGLEQIIWTARDWFRQSRFPKWQWIAPVGAIALVSVALVPGYVNGNMNLIDRFSLVDIRPLLWRWSDINVPAEGRILMHPRSDLHLTWNREWGGYDGVQTFLWWHEDETAIAASTPEIYAERGIVYFALSEGDLVRFFNQPEMETFISRLTLVKTIPTGPGITGSSVYFYRMLPPQNPTDFTFSDQITLVGYDLTDTRLIPGDTITIRPYWRIQRQPETNYQMFIHLYSADDVNLLSQHDTQPASPQRPTLTWDDPSELYIGQDVPISIPVDLESGAYRLAIGLYDLNTFQRLVTTEGADFFEIPITIGDS